jgi:D-alanine-D-alanine ligase
MTSVAAPRRVAVVCNQGRDGVIFQGPRPSPERYGRKTIERVLTALRERFDDVGCLEGDATLLPRLSQFMGAQSSGPPTGLVLNMAYGIQGDCRYTHVPAMLEMAGVPYTGAGPLGHAVSLDKVIAKSLMQAARIPTPAYAVASGCTGPEVERLRYPLVVKPRHESTSYGLRLVHDRGQLDDAVAEISERFRQDALIEEYIEGREVCVGLLGNSPVEALPTVELDFEGRGLRLMTWDDKYHRRADEPGKICPAALSYERRRQLADVAVATFGACHCRDYARVDIRLDHDGHPWVLEINSMASLGLGGSYVCAAAAAGLGFEALIDRIVHAAWDRHVRTVHQLVSDSVGGPP